MQISVLGLGYVGTVAAACLAARGHNVIVADANAAKTKLLALGKSPVHEAGLPELIKQAVNVDTHAIKPQELGVSQGRLQIAADTGNAVTQSDISLICVGTPSNSDGSVDFSALEIVCKEIGAALKKMKRFHVVVVRSTVPPGTLRTQVIPWLESASGLKAGKDFGVCNNPEFLREGSAVNDFFYPSKTVVGASDPLSSHYMESLYATLGQQVIHCPIEVAEMVKYADNAFHALKITFANEIGRLCKASGVDSHAVMNVFCQDTKLNISKAYLKPGFAFGGSCLPKDLRSVINVAKSHNVELPVLSSVIPSNEIHIAAVQQRVDCLGKKRIGILGVSFKAGTDDARESPLVALAERLLQVPYEVTVYDAFAVAIPEALEKRRASSAQALCEMSDVLIIGHNTPEFSSIAQYVQPHHSIIDLVRIPSLEAYHGQYDGISW